MFIATVRITIFSLVMALLIGLVYPLAVTGAAQALFPKRANGSLIVESGTVIGSTLIAQNFTEARYFHPRPSAVGFSADNSGGSNLGVTSKALNDMLKQRIAAEKDLNGDGKIPADLIMASGSGLDPHITPEAALYQAQRIAKARNLKIENVRALVARMTEGPTLGILGMPRVNVLAINRALDRMSGE